MSPHRSIGIVVVDDHEIAREGVRARLEVEPDFEILGECLNADELIPTCEKTNPQIVLMDVDMPGSDPFTMIADLRRVNPEVRVIMLSAYARDGYIDSAAQAGAWGYLSKTDPFENIIRAIRKVHGGQFAYPDEVLERFEYTDGHLRPKKGESSSPISTLTPRELEVMRLIAKGLSTKEIAAVLHRSAKTIDAHRTSLMKKLQIDDRVELTRYAIREGLVEP